MNNNNVLNVMNQMDTLLQIMDIVLFAGMVKKVNFMLHIKYNIVEVNKDIIFLKKVANLRYFIELNSVFTIVFFFNLFTKKIVLIMLL